MLWPVASLTETRYGRLGFGVLISGRVVQLDGDPLFGFGQRQSGDIDVAREAKVDVAIGLDDEGRRGSSRETPAGP